MLHVNIYVRGVIMTKKSKLSSAAILGIIIFSILLVSIIFLKEIMYIFQNLGKGSEWLKSYIQGLGIAGVIIIVFLQMMLVRVGEVGAPWGNT